MQSKAGLALSAEVGSLAVYTVWNCAVGCKHNVRETSCSRSEGGNRGEGADGAELSALALETVLEAADAGPIVVKVSVEASCAGAIAVAADAVGEAACGILGALSILEGVAVLADQALTGAVVAVGTVLNLTWELQALSVAGFSWQLEGALLTLNAVVGANTLICAAVGDIVAGGGAALAVVERVSIAALGASWH